MNQKKIGQFICDLRNEKKLSQEELASYLYVSREAVSKWERGLSCPGPDILLKLSEYFNVSVNELLYGEKTTEDNKNNIEKVTTKLYTNQKRSKKVIIFLCVIIILCLLGFLVLMVLNNYNSISVYGLGAHDIDTNLSNGVLAVSKERVFLSTGYIKSTKNIKSIEIYYIKENGQKEFVISGGHGISVNEAIGYNECFDIDDSEDIKHILDNLYIKITYKDNTKSYLKFGYEKIMANDYIFPNLSDHI